MKCPPAPIRWRIAALLLVAAAAITPAAIFVDRTFATEVTLIEPHDPATIAHNRSVYAYERPVIEIYGTPRSGTRRLLLASDDDVIRPREDSSLHLMPLDREQKGIEIATLFSAARGAIVLFLVLAGVLLTIGRDSIFRRDREVVYPCGQNA